jgi:glycosyltransferase involved in cell wall biosynthesis
MLPLVTIGIPTYGRPHLLGRALRSVAAQDYRNLEVIVADNCSPGERTIEVVESYRSMIPGLRFVRHAENIGALANFFFLLEAASGHYFMWLADDDEISPRYVSALCAVLERNSDAASAVAHWVLMSNERSSVRMPTSWFGARSAFLRALRFIWRSDDAFFYALHRTEALRRATFRRYWWRNRDVLMNWAYVYLLDMVLTGRILLTEDESVQFINHDYSHKTYSRSTGDWLQVPFYLLRRINVHWLYWEKCARVLPPLAMPLIVATSAVSLVREVGELLLRRLHLAGFAR